MKSESTSNYSQPPFYRFSRDSVELAILAEALEREKESLNILEFFAGSGVVSIEFSSRHPSVESVTLVELQEEFKKHLERNSKNLNCDFNIQIKNFLDFDSTEKFDVILANPPYFNPNASRLGEDKNRNLCRFEMNFNTDDLLRTIEKFLTPDGSAYICHRSNLEKLDYRIKKVGQYQMIGLFRFCLNVD